MSILDIVVIVILLAALVHGFFKGLFRPLITWAFIVAGVVIGFGHPAVAERFAPSPGWRPIMGLVVVAVFAVVGGLISHLVAPRIYRLIPGMGALDHVLGAVFSFVLAFAMVFLLLKGLVTLDRAAAPIDGNSPLSASEISQIQQFVTSNPATDIALDPSQLQSLENQLGSSTQPAGNVGQLNGMLGVLRNLHTQMVQSKVAPVIFDIGEHLPFIGGSQTWPSS
jgi:uncharacterized membrane protein required for colicin V production